MPLATAARPLPATAPAMLHPHQSEEPKVRLWAMLDLPDDVPRPHNRGTPAFAAMRAQLLDRLGVREHTA